jgi:hypothetical protein
MVKDTDSKTIAKYLCGHDERHWFVAAIPEMAHAKNIEDAMRALKPEAVVSAQKGIRKKNRNKRKNEAYIRQGEWFFVPEPQFSVDENLILKKEPISRGRGSKAHICEELYRTGGETVWTAGGEILTVSEFQALPDDSRRKRYWRQQVRNPQVYVRGKIVHSDHSTIELKCWHRVLMNKENESVVFSKMQFID